MIRGIIQLLPPFFTMSPVAWFLNQLGSTPDHSLLYFVLHKYVLKNARYYQECPPKWDEQLNETTLCCGLQRAQ